MKAGAALPRTLRGTHTRRRAGWIYWAVIAPTLAAILGFGGVYSYVWAPVDAALFVGLAVHLWRRALSGRSLLAHPILVPMGGFGALVAIQWGFRLSVYPGATLTGLIKVAGCGAAFYLALVAFRRDGNLTRLGGLLWLFCGLLAAEAVFQAFGANGYIYWLHNATYATPVGPFLYHNFYAGCVDLLLPIAVVYSFRKEQTSEATWALWLRRGLVPGVAAVSMVISQSRGGILVMLAEAGLGVAVFWPELTSPRRNRVMLAAGAALLLGFTALANWGPVGGRFRNLAKHDASALDRLAVARSCWHIFLDHPWLGTGFGTFAAVYPAYQTFDSGLTWDQAHDDYAQTLAETGVLGGLFVVGFFGIWGWSFWRCRVRGTPGLARNLRLACFIGTAGFLAHAFGDFQFHAPGNALLFFLLVGAAVAPWARPRAPFGQDAPISAAGCARP